jgi:PBS lyase HEAT-like repeat
MFLAIIFSSLIMLGPQQPPQQFSSAADALYELDHMTECHCDTDVKAQRYFLSHPDESIPVLIDFTLKHKGRRRISIGALSKIRDERVITFLLQLTYDELLVRPNPIGDDVPYDLSRFFESDELVGYLIAALGNYGDKRAIPIIEESLGRLHNHHRDADREALCELGEISISELFELHLESSAEKIHSIASQNVYSNPKFSVEVFNWIINRSPQRLTLLRSCHTEKVRALYYLQEYALALAECEFIKQSINGVSDQEPQFSVDHRGYSLDEMIELLKAKVETNK